MSDRTPPHREIVDINIYPWSAVGKINVASVSVRRSCSGAAIGPNEFLTAAHCIYNDMINRFFAARALHFLLGYARGEYRVHRVAARYIVPPSYVPKETAGDDWAVVYIEDSFPTDVKLLRLATEIPSPGTAVKTGGYPVERQSMMTADKHCNIRGIAPDGKLMTHDCVIHHGDSGGPLLSAHEQDDGLILGVNVLAYSSIVELQEQSKEGGIAVSAASINQFLNSRVVGRLF